MGGREGMKDTGYRIQMPNGIINNRLQQLDGLSVHVTCLPYPAILERGHEDFYNTLYVGT